MKNPISLVFLLMLINACTIPRYNFYKNRDCIIEYGYQRSNKDTIDKVYYYKHSYIYFNGKRYLFNMRFRQELELDIDMFAKKRHGKIDFTEYGIDTTMSPYTGINMSTDTLAFVRVSDYIYQNKGRQDTMLYIIHHLYGDLVRGNVTIPDSLCFFYEPNSSCPIPDQVFGIPFMQPVRVQKMSSVSSKWLRKQKYIKSKRNKFYLRYCD